MRILQDLVLISLLAGACSQAQDTEAGKVSAAPKLEFSNPRAVEDLDVAPMIVGRLDCSDDGSIYTLMDGYALSSEKLALLAIHPDGTVTSFPWRSAPGFADISMPKSIFVGNGRVYVLVNAESKSAKQEHRSHYPLVLAFDLSRLPARVGRQTTALSGRNGFLNRGEAKWQQAYWIKQKRY